MKTIIKPIGDDAYKEAGDILKRGGIVAFPTDTVYGLGAVYTDDGAVEKIFEAKGRDEKKPLSILVSSMAEAYELAENISEDAKKLMEVFWPGALTVIVKKSERVSERISAGGNTVGIRMPDSAATLSIIKAAGSPLAAPSANTSGKRSAACAEDVKEDLDGKIDMIVDGGSCPVGISSTVVDISKGSIDILREGTVSREMIEKVLRSKS